MDGYNLQQKIISFSGGTDVWRAEKEIGGAPVLVLRFPRREGIDPGVYRRGVEIASQLRNDAALLPILEPRFDEGEFACCIAYSCNLEMAPLTEMLGRYAEEKQNALWAMRAIAEKLESLHKRRVSGHFLGAEGVFVDEGNFTARLGFIGLSEIFRAHGAGPWAENTPPPDWRDDVYHLAGCFEHDMLMTSDADVRACRADEKSARPDYPKLLRAMAADVVFRPCYSDEMLLLFANNIDADSAINHLNHLNLNDCYVSPWRGKEVKGKRSRDCNFYTHEFCGVFVQSEGDKHFYVPSFRRVNSPPSGTVLRVQFQRTEQSVRGISDEYHHLAVLGDEKSGTIQEWRLVPEQEKEYIEETAFRAAYVHFRVMDKSVNKFSFLLRKDEDTDWQQMEALREKQKRLDAVPMRAGRRRADMDVGVVYDTSGRFTVWVESDKDGAADAGELLVGGGLTVPFEFHWRKDRRRICFVAPRGFDAEEALAAIEEMRQNGDAVDVSVKGLPGKIGMLDDAAELREIITMDAQTSAGIPESGNLHEDVSNEIIPLNRQIEAVSQFERGDMAEPALGGILATPSAHRPLITPLVEFASSSASAPSSDAAVDSESKDSQNQLSVVSPAAANFTAGKLVLFDQQLNESQQQAVRGALFQKPLFLIQGPPGTGKTTVIVEIICQMLAANPRARILLCSQTNLAVDNVIEKLPSDKKKTGRAVVRKVRLARNEKTITKDVRPYWFDKRFKIWFSDAINRSQQVAKGAIAPAVFVPKSKSEFARKLADAVEKAEAPAQKREKMIGKIVKKWHAFLHDSDPKWRQMRGNAEGGWLPLETAFLKSMNVVGATCVHIASGRYRDIFSDTYDCVIMDEAGKATPAESLIPIVRARQTVLVGDHKQLPPFVTGEKKVWKMVQGKSEELQDEGMDVLRRRFGESLFERLIKEPQMEGAQVMLDTQRRMPKQIGDIISRFFYEDKLRSPDDAEYARKKQVAMPFKRRTGLVFIKTDGQKDRHDNGGSHWRQNKCSARVVMKILRCLDDNLEKQADVAVIAAYRGQVDLLRKMLRREKRSKGFRKIKGLNNGDPGTIVNTVDGFQGRESAIVIYDVVRSSSGSATVGFLDEPRRLNVALSRAQQLLIVVGDADFLINRARPGADRKLADKPILGEISEEILRQGFIFDHLEEALQ